MEESNVVTLSNGIEYTELYRIIDNGNTYVLLADLENPKKFCIKKVINKNGKEFVSGLKDRAEFDKVMELFVKKYLS